MSQIENKVRIETAELDRALVCAVELFRDWEWSPPGGRAYLAVPSRDGHTTLDVQRDVILPLALAGRHFKWSFPAGLEQKLRNHTQTIDTLFELVCLGLFSRRHSVTYEPQLESGKVPDLRVELDGGPQVYVECKSHHMMEAVYWDRFQRVSSRLCEAVYDLPVVKDAYAEGLRTEFHSDGRPSDFDIGTVREKVIAISRSELRAGVEILPNTTIKLVPRRQPPPTDYGMYAGLTTIGADTWTALTLENTAVVAYAWPRLLRECRSSQRKLLGEARRKLRGILQPSFGLICIQTTLTKHFFEDIHALIDGDQFRSIPIIWVNPSVYPGRESRIIFRPEADALVERLFGLNASDDETPNLQWHP